MAQKTWTINLEDGTHTVELEHGYLSGKRAIRVDGRPIMLSKKAARSFMDFGSGHQFQIRNHTIAVHIRANGLTYAYDLSIDGRSVSTGGQVALPAPMPGWAWVFVAACALIPVLTLGGAIPAGIGFGGASGCYAIAKDDSKEANTRVLLCLGVTILSWGLFAALIVVIGSLMR